MSDYDSDKQLARLLPEINTMTRPRSLGDFVNDTTGVFLPGFSALPAVTILSNDSWKTKVKPEPERWRTGEMVALRAVAGTRADAKQQTLFFTPIGDVTIPLINASRGKDMGRLHRSIDLRPKDRWEPVEIQFAFLPWDYERDSVEWSSEDLLEVSRALEFGIRHLRISVDAGGKRIDVAPQFGVSSWVGKRSLDSLRFPLNYASQIISPFIVRLRIDPRARMADGRKVDLTKEAVTVNFEIADDDLRGIYREAGMGQPDISGISVFANALPLMNVDLRAWQLDDTFDRFVSTSGMRPLGAAGIFPYRKAGKLQKDELEPLSMHANVFSMEIKDGHMLTGYSLPGEEDSTREKQLLMWMTHGPHVNGASYKYDGGDVIQPLQKPSLLLNQAFTVLPCFGGQECHPDESDWNKKLLLTYSSMTQSLLHKDGLIAAVSDIVLKLGYDRVDVEGPVTELRVLEGVRRRVTTVRLRNRGGKRLDQRHLRMIQGFVNDRAPVGAAVHIELV